MDTLIFVGSILVGLLVLTFLVVIHELGHAIVARRNGVEVEEFGVGFPPRAWSIKPKKSFLGKDVEYSLNWLPIGGFVKLKGENDSDRRKGTLGASSFWSKTKIMLAGVAINWLFAIVLLTIVAWVGMPRILPGQFTVESDTSAITQPLTIGTIQPGSPAESAGLKSGDQVVAIDGSEEAGSYVGFFEALEAKEGQPIELTYSRDGEQDTVEVGLRSGEEAANSGRLGAGISPDSEIRYSTWSAPIVGAVVTAQFSWETITVVGETLGKALGGFIGQLSLDESSRQAADQQLADAQQNVAGPIGIIGDILPNMVSAGLVPFLLITAIISLTLAVMNILPIPALDGGRFYTMAIFRLIKKPLTKELEEKINIIGMMIVFALIILVTVSDVNKLF